MAKQVLTVGENITASLDGTTLTLVIDLSKRLRPSGTGKNTVIATTSGNQSVVCGNDIVKLGINCYTK